MTRKNYRQAGFTMLEILISVIILSIGLLGVAGMQANSLKNNHTAFTKTQASNLAADMADRIRANRGGLNAYNGFDTDVDSTTQSTCIHSAQGCTAQAMAAHDLHQWSQQFKRSSKPILPDGRGIIDVNGDDITVSILWKDLAYSDGNGGESNITVQQACRAEQTVGLACFSVTFSL